MAAMGGKATELGDATVYFGLMATTFLVLSITEPNAIKEKGHN